MSSAAFSEVEDIGRIPAPITNAYIDADSLSPGISYAYDEAPNSGSNFNALPNPSSSDFDLGQIPSAVVDFRPVDALFDLDPVVLSDLLDTDQPDDPIGGLIFSQQKVRSWRNGVIGPILVSSLASQDRPSQKPLCTASTPSSNIVRCQFYADDARLNWTSLTGDTSANESSQQETFKNSSLQNLTTGILQTTPWIAQFEKTIADCGEGLPSCLDLKWTYAFPAALSATENLAVVGPPADPSADDALSTPSASELTAFAPASPDPIPESPTLIMVTIGLGALALAGRKKYLRTLTTG